MEALEKREDREEKLMNWAWGGKAVGKTRERNRRERKKSEEESKEESGYLFHLPL